MDGKVIDLKGGVRPLYLWFPSGSVVSRQVPGARGWSLAGQLAAVAPPQKTAGPVAYRTRASDAQQGPWVHLVGAVVGPSGALFFFLEL